MFIKENVVPPAKVTLHTCQDETTRPPSCLASPRRVGDPLVNSSLNFSKKQVKTSSPVVTRGRVVSGTRDPVNGGPTWSRVPGGPWCDCVYFTEKSFAEYSEVTFL